MPGSIADRLAVGNTAAEILEQEILTRLVALNHERAAEETTGHIRYLRPEYQAPGLDGRQKTEDGGQRTEDAEDVENGGKTGKTVTGSSGAPSATSSLFNAGTMNTLGEAAREEAPGGQHPWPDELPAQFSLVRRLLEGNTLSVADSVTVLSAKLSGRNTPKRRAQLQSILETLKSLGHT